jgi:hypothetical protein
MLNVAKISLVLASVLLAALGFVAAAQTAPTRSTESLLANVLDRNGNAVRDLTKDSFRVEVNKRSAAVVEANYSVGPRRIAVLLDISGSMAEDKQNKKWRIAHEALDDLLAETPPEVAIAFLTFSDRVHDVFDFSQSRASVAAWIKEGPSQTNIKIHGRTALYDAVVTANKMFGAARPGDSIYAITDGGDNSSHISETATRKLLSESGVRFFVFLLSERLPSELERTGRDAVMDIVRGTGGFVFGVPGRVSGVQFQPSFEYVYDYDERTREKIKVYTQALNIQVNGFYTLRLESPIALDRVRKVSLDIVDGTGKPRKDVAFTYSSALPPQPK